MEKQLEGDDIIQNKYHFACAQQIASQLGFNLNLIFVSVRAPSPFHLQLPHWMRLPVMLAKFAPAVRADPLPQRSSQTRQWRRQRRLFTHQIDGFSVDLKFVFPIC